MTNPTHQIDDQVLIDDIAAAIARRLQIPVAALAEAKASALNYLARPRPAATSSRKPS